MKKINPQTYLDLDRIILQERFAHEVDRLREIARQTFEHIEANLDKPYDLHGAARATRDNFGAPLPRGQRDETLLRHYLVAECYRIWQIGHQQKPVINNKGYPATPFVIFIEKVFGLLGVGKIEDHLEAYESYRKKQLKDSGL